MAGYISTVQIAIEADSVEDACDAMSAMLTDTLGVDWRYITIGDQYLYPSEIVGGFNWRQTLAWEPAYKEEDNA